MRRHLCGFAFVAVATAQAASLPSGVRLLPGPVNGLLVNESVVVYGDPTARVTKASHVLFTHARRDVVWAGEALAGKGAAVVVPQRERQLFEHPDAFWQSYETKRFHDYTQVNTKVLRKALKVSQAVQGGDALNISGLKIEVLDTPGYTPGSVSYLFELGGKRIACTGDLIYGDGQLFDVSSLQDAIPEAKARGYHGYAARAGDLMESLRKIAAWKPDVIVPARGPLIENPRASIDKLILRLQTLMASHFATDALLWYWGPDNLRIRSRKVLDGRPVDSMAMAEQRPLPEWAVAVGNSRVLISKSGNAFVVDAGYKGLMPALDDMQSKGRVKSVEGIWITHYHDDHTDYAQQLASKSQCPIYFTSSMTDVLEKPSHYRLPCLTESAITSGKPQPDGAKMRWHEFQFTFFRFPGQTLYHGGLLVERDGGEALFFVGDSFTPSGIDDYCLQNRDFVNEGEGILYCLRVLQQLRSDAWLINQHVAPTFRFSTGQFDRMRKELMKRAAVLKELSPWPDPNYAVDESWAAVHPYGTTTRRGASVTLELRIFNHSPRAETYAAKWNLPVGWRVLKADQRTTIAPRSEGALRVTIAAETPGLHAVTADVSFAGRTLREWIEALVRVQPE